MENRIITQNVGFPLNGDVSRGYLARPSAAGSVPMILVVQEWWGLEPHIKDVVERLARQGFAAFAPDLYKGAVATEPDEARKMAMGLDMPAAVSELTRGLTYLRSQGNPGRKFGIIGFCMGGGLALQAACESDVVDACVVFYGRNPDPIDKVENLRAPLLGIYAENDQGIPVSEVERLRSELNRRGKEHEIHIYPDAGHAFFNDTHGSYKADAAADAWERTLAFFRKHLIGN